MENYNIYISSNYAYQFKKIVKPFNAFINNLKLYFNYSGVIINIDGVINDVELYSNYFDEYYCNKPFNIEIDDITLKQLFKNVKDGDIIYIEVKNDEPNNPYLIIKNNNKKKEVVIKLLINGDNSSKIV